MHRCCIHAMTTFYTYPEHTPSSATSSTSSKSAARPSIGISRRIGSSRSETSAPTASIRSRILWDFCWDEPYVGGSRGGRHLTPKRAASRGDPSGAQLVRINGAVATLRPDGCRLPERCPVVDRFVENPDPDLRKPPKKTEPGLDPKHGCSLVPLAGMAQEIGHELDAIPTSETRRVI